MFVDMTAGKIKGFLVMGQNPAVGGQNARFQRKALAKLDWMVVRDFFETETSAFWRNSPEIQSGELKTSEIKTEVFFLPAAVVAEMEGSFTNTQRLLQRTTRPSIRPTTRAATPGSPTTSASGSRSCTRIRPTTATGRSGTSCGTTSRSRPKWRSGGSRTNRRPTSS